MIQDYWQEPPYMTRFVATPIPSISSLLLLVSLPAFAADIPNIIQGIQGTEAGIVGRNIMHSSAPAAPVIAPSFQISKPVTPAISAEAEKYSFVLENVQIEGNHVFSTAKLENIFKPYFHKKISVAKLQSLVNDISNQYQEAGYFLSKAFLPPQEIANGVVKITVVEGFISQIKIQGLKREQLIKFADEFGDKIKGDKPIRLKTLERYLLILNDISGFNVKSVIEPDPTTPLGSKLTLATEITTLDASVSQDNYQTPYLGPNETGVNASLNSVLTAGGTFYGRALVADEAHKMSYYELRHSQVLSSEGLLFSVDAYQTKTNPQFILAPLEIFGLSQDVNTSLSYPIIRSRNRNLNIQAQYDYMTNSSMALGQEVFFDRIQDLTLTGSYSDVLWKGEDSIILTVDQGLSNLGHRAFNSRFNARGDFFKLTGYASRTQYLNDRFSLYGMLTAQYANHILPSSETFTFGGPYLGRGYDWSQFTGDEGVAGKAEFRVNMNHNLPFLKQIQYYTFYDAGLISSLIPLIKRSHGSSVGFGFRSAVINHINAEAFVGKPLTTPNASQVVKGKTGHAFLGFFQVTAYL